MTGENRIQQFFAKFRRQSEPCTEPFDIKEENIAPEHGWKETALADFKAWLDDLPEEKPAPPGKASADGLVDGCDLYTLLMEFTALRQEIRLQNREQNNAIRVHGDLVDNTMEYATLFKERTRDLDTLAERIHNACETRTAASFFDVRDAMVRGLEAVQEALAAGIYFRRSSRRRIEGVAEGYEMALRRFDRILAKFGITPVVSAGQPFNPSLMRAVGKRNDPEKDHNVVLEEYLRGFTKGEKVLRTAEVIVNSKTD